MVEGKELGTSLPTSSLSHSCYGSSDDVDDERTFRQWYHPATNIIHRSIDHTTWQGMQ
jgi:hypothetical protein